MDIAEIRKKAKAQPKAEPEVLEPVVEEAHDPVEEPVTPGPADGQADDMAAPEPGSGLPEEYSAANSSLDQLFAVTEEFALATDDTYSDQLEKQTEGGDRVSCQYLAFHLGSEEYALDIRQISEIIKVREFTDIPRAPEFVLGIISLRGVVVPIYDLARRLNLGASDLSALSRIVVCQLEDVAVGLLVDSINQVVRLADDDLEPPPGVLSGLDRELVAGIGRYQGRMIILLNLKSVLDVEIERSPS